MDHPTAPDSVTPALSHLAGLPADRQLADFLREEHIHCPVCNAPLRGVAQPRCPRCKEPLTLGVGLAEPQLLAWLALVVPMCLAAGMGLLIAVVSIKRGGIPSQGPRQGLYSPEIRQLAIFTMMGAMPATLVIVFLRRRFQRLERRTQWILALIGALISVFGLLGIMGEH